MSIFGQFAPLTIVEDLFVAKLRDWAEDYLGEVERVTGRDQGSIARPRTYGIPDGTFDKQPENALPLVGVVSSGMVAPPTRSGDGAYTGTYRFELHCIVSAPGFDATNRLVKDYAAAMSLLLLQQPLGEPVDELEMVDDDYADLSDPKKSRTVLGARVDFDVIVSGIYQRRAGPTEPQGDREPHPDWPTVTEPPEITLEHRS